MALIVSSYSGTQYQWYATIMRGDNHAWGSYDDMHWDIERVVDGQPLGIVVVGSIQPLLPPFQW
jgi:hypothetical protein